MPDKELLNADPQSLAAALNALPLGTMVFRSLRDSNQKIVDFEILHGNTVACELLGKSLAELRGRTLLTELPGNFENGLFDRYVQVVESGIADSHEFKYEADGLNSWFSNWSAKAGDGFVVAFADVTGKRAARLERYRTARLVQAMYDESPFAKALVDSKTGEIQLANQAFRDLLGSSKDTENQQNPDSVRPGSSPGAQDVLSIIDQVRESGVSYSVGEKPLVIDASGETRYYRLDVGFLGKNDETFAEEIQVAAFDVTDFVSSRHRAEQLAWKLAEEEEQYRTTFDTAPIGIAHLDQAGKFTFANDYFLKLLGLKSEHLTQLVPSNLCADAEDAENLKQLFETRKPARQIDLRFRRSDDSSIWVSATLSVLRGRNGLIRNHILVVEDISKRIEARERLVQSMRHKDEFLAILGHELRNPLAALRGAAALFEGVSTQEPALLRIRETLERQTRQMGRLLDDLLEVGRISRGKLALEKKSLNFSELVKAVVTQHAQAVDPEHQLLAFKEHDKSLCVLGDEFRLTQVLQNLLTNALKYTPSGGLIEVSVAEQGEFATVSVKDNGVGLEPEFMNRLFTPFEQAPQDLARSQGGLGLGLALSAQIVKSHGGRIDAFSEGRGKGSTFVVFLPLKSAEVNSDAPAPPSGKDLGTLSIMLVEDNLDAGELMQMLLEAQGHQVTLFDRADRALSEIEDSGVQLVICDIGLPSMTGYEFARRVRDIPKLKKLPMIALSGYGRSQDKELALEAGFDAHLKKPADYAEIISTAKQIFRAAGV